MKTILGLLFVLAIFAMALSHTVAAQDLASEMRPAQLRAHSSGTNVRAADGSLWLITNERTRRQYSSVEAFQSYRFNDINLVIPMRGRDNHLPIGDAILPVEGRVYVQNSPPNQGQVYLMSGNTRHPFNSATIFTALGFNFATISWGDLSLATEGYALTSENERHPKGTLINDGGYMYYTSEYGRIAFPSLDVFFSWGYSFGDVVTATSGDRGLPIETVEMAARIPGQLSPR